MKRIVLASVVVLLVAAAAFWWIRASRENPIEDAYVRGREVTVWSRLAQVREPIAMLRFGDRVGVLERRGAKTRVRTAAGAVGWVDEAQLTSLDLWQRGAQLVEQARAMPLQGHGHTKVSTNLRAEAGRSGPRLYQFRAGVPVDVLARAVAEVPASGSDASNEAAEGTGPKLEDWLFIRSRTEEAGELAGWVLGRFIQPDLPEALSIYAAGIRFIAWFELNRVQDDGQEKPQYLAVGASGPEGQPCDFTLLRVYTWGTARHRYETAFLDSNLCGKLPVRVETKGNDISFWFTNTGKSGVEERRYAMRNTSVRRVTSR